MMNVEPTLITQVVSQQNKTHRGIQNVQWFLIQLLI